MIDETRPAPLLMDVPAVANLLGLSTNVVRDEVQAGRMPHRRVGRRIMLTRQDVDDYLDAVRTVGVPARTVDRRTGRGRRAA